MEDIGHDEVADWGVSTHRMSSARVVVRVMLSCDAVRAEQATSPSMSDFPRDPQVSGLENK